MAIARTQTLEARHGVIAYGIMADLLLVVPGLWLLLVVRKHRARARTLIPVLALSAVGAVLVLPPPYRSMLWVLVLPVELAATGLLVWAAARAIRRRPGVPPADPGTLPERLAAAARSAFGFAPPAEVFTYEVALLAFAFAGWRMRPLADQRSFTLHRQSGWAGAALGLGLVLLCETFPVHLAVSQIHPALAWILTALSAYSLVWLIGDYQGLRLRPCRIEDEALLVRVGLRWRARVPLAAIAEVAPLRGDLPPRRERGYLRATVIGDPTVLVRLTEAVQATGPYGWNRAVGLIGLAPDEPGAFVAALREAIDTRLPSA